MPDGGIPPGQGGIPPGAEGIPPGQGFDQAPPQQPGNWGGAPDQNFGPPMGGAPPPNAFGGPQGDMQQNMGG